jgi:hypothetical protein
MDTSPSLIIKNYFSKQINKYDNLLTFDQKLSRVLKLNNKTKIFTPKELKNLFFQKSKTNTDYSLIKSKIGNKKSNLKLIGFSPMNIIAKQKRISYLPKISPYILSNKSSIIIDYNKAAEMGSEGFKDLCNNEDKAIKEILFAYNDHNYKSLKDFNSFSYFNKVNENIDNNKTASNNNNSELKNTFYGKNNYYNNDNENKSIFDKKFMKKSNSSKLKILLKKKLERIKYRNEKSAKIYEQYHKQSLINKKDNGSYKIKYNSIEKHIPYTILSSNSQRASPKDMLQTNYSCSYIKKNVINKKFYSSENKKIITNKNLNKKISNKFYIT